MNYEIEVHYFDKENRAMFGITGRTKDFYEFIAFVCWYVVLIICCIIPTACAYRRRRQEERRANESVQVRWGDIENRDPTLGFIGTGNGTGSNGGTGNNASDEDSEDEEISLIFFQSPEFAYEIRRRREQAAQRRLEAKRDVLSAQMAETKMIVSSANIVQINPEQKESDAQPDIEEGTGEDKNSKQKSNSNKNDPNKKNTRILSQADTTDAVKKGEYLFFDEKPCYLKLPEVNEKGVKVNNGGPRSVTDTCAICLCQYEEGDIIVWSSNKACQHVFHEDCILTWLVKKDEALCPFCRQPFLSNNVQERNQEPNESESPAVNPDGN